MIRIVQFIKSNARNCTIINCHFYIQQDLKNTDGLTMGLLKMNVNEFQQERPLVFA